MFVIINKIQNDLNIKEDFECIYYSNGNFFLNLQNTIKNEKDILIGLESKNALNDFFILSDHTSKRIFDIFD